MDKVLKSEFGLFYVGFCCLCEIYFGGVVGFETVSEIVFKKCMEGNNPFFGSEGWSEWLVNVKEKDVLV